MVSAMVNISNEANQVLNIVKAKYNLKDKSQAINKVVLDYSQELLDLKLRPEYAVKLNKIMKGHHLTKKEFEKEVK